MKKYCLLLLCISVIVFHSQAQDKPETVKKKNWLTESVKEKFRVLRSNNKVKEGLYEAIYTDTKVVIARGNYQDNKRVGIWYFFDTQQKLVEAFDYTNNRLLDEEPINTTSRRYIGYAFDEKLKDSDKITKPLRIGGRCYGYIPYMQLFHLSADYNDIDVHQLFAQLELLISPGGRLADLKVHIYAPDNSEQVTTISPGIFSNEDRQFIPATINGQPVMSRIFLACSLTMDGGLDIRK